LLRVSTRQRCCDGFLETEGRLHGTARYAPPQPTTSPLSRAGRVCVVWTPPARATTEGPNAGAGHQSRDLCHLSHAGFAWPSQTPTAVICSSECIPLKPLAATESSAPGSCGAHSRVPSRGHGRPPSRGGGDLSRCDSA